MKISVTIVVYRPDLDLLGQVIDALSTGKPDSVDLQLQVIDNSEQASVNRRLRESAQQWPALDYRIYSNINNIGFGKAHNQVLGNLKSDYHLILNPDVVIEPGAMSSALEYMEQNSGASMLTPKSVDASGKQVFLCKRYPTVVDLLLRGFAPEWLKRHFDKRLARYEMRDITCNDPVTNIPIASGCFMFFRTGILRNLGGFSPEYFMYFEDFDLCMRMHDRYRIDYVPTVQITHTGGNTARKGTRHIRMFCVSASRFFSHWGWKWW